MGGSSGFTQAATAALVIGGSAALIAGTGGAAAPALAPALASGAGFGAAGAGALAGGGATLGAIAPLVLAGAGTAVSAYGQIQQGQAEAQLARYQSQVAKNNAELAKRNAADAALRGAQKEQQSRLKTRLIGGSYRASAAGRGVEVDSGSSLDAMVDIAGVGELDALLIRDNAAREAAGYEAQSNEFTAEAGFRRTAGRNATRASYINAGSTLLTGGSAVASKWYQL